MANFQNALQDDDILEQLHGMIHSGKARLDQPVDDPTVILTDVNIPHSPGHPKLFPTRFIIEVHINYSTYNIDKLVYIGDNKHLIEHIK
jgi:hypothetical protein